MFFDESKNYKEIDDTTFDNEIERFKGHSDVVGSIYYFFKDSNGDIVKLSRNKNANIQINDDCNLICKYYVIRIKIDEPLVFQFEDVGEACKIYNLGNFFVSNLYEMKKERKKEIKLLFEKYDKSFSFLSFPWDDEEFLEKYNYRNL